MSQVERDVLKVERVPVLRALLIDLLPELERAWRQAGQAQRGVLARLLADAYQAAASAFARLDEAEHVARTGIIALSPAVAGTDPQPAVETLSLYGALNLVLAIVHARAGRRSDAREASAEARRIGQLLGADRNDYETEFGPTNIELHAIAVELGDAGEALDLASNVDATGLSAERQSRLHIDLARAHA